MLTKILHFKDTSNAIVAGKYRRYEIRDSYRMIMLHIYVSGLCFLHIGDATLSITREQAYDLLRENDKNYWERTH